ncbi:MAG: beta-galactosidase trimerization domain-containing protein [Clostridiales bacterium]|nr:beta-galactosidase trimerization domain-containing protein [Clostridiales bacterium]
MNNWKWYEKPMVLSAVQCNYGEDSYDIMKNHVLANDFNGEQLLHLNATGHVSNYDEVRDGDKLDRYLEESKKNNLRQILYWNVHCVYEETILEHPNWKQKFKNGDDVRAYGNQYLICINSPWMDEYLKNLIKLCNHKLDGLFLDGPLFAQGGCYCEYCQTKFKKAYGREIFDAEYNEYLEFRANSVTDMIKATYETKEERNPDIKLYINNSALRGDVTGSNTSKVYPYVDFLGTEGGFCWINKEFDYTFTTCHAKYIETKADGKPYVVFIAGDAKPYSYCMYTGAETERLYALSLAQGANIWYGIHGPTKMFKCDAGRVSARFNKYIKENEEHLINTKSYSKVALMWSDPTSNYYASSVMKSDFTDQQVIGGEGKNGNHHDALAGFADILMRSHVQFDIADQACIYDRRIFNYDLLIFPTYACVSEEEADIIREFVKGGGNIISTFDTGMYDSLGVKRESGILDDVFGIKRGNQVEYTDVGIGYTKLHEDIEEKIIPMSGFAWESEPVSGAELLAESYYPMEGRYVAFPTDSYGYIVKNQFGEGSSLYISGTLGEVYNEWCNPDNRKMIARRIVEMTSPMMITNAPQSVEISLRKQMHTGNYQIHVVNMTRGPGRPMEETISVHNISVELAGIVGESAKGIFTGTDYEIEKTEKGCKINIQTLNEYEVIVVREDK